MLKAVLLSIILVVTLFAQPRAVLPLIDGAAAANLVVKQVPPAFPPNILADTTVQGVVHLVVEIDPNGKLQSARVVGGPAMLRQAGLDNIKQWTFRAYVQGGKPTAIRANFDVVFNRI